MEPWSCPRLPHLLGPTPEVDNFWVACGMNSKGIGAGGGNQIAHADGILRPAPIGPRHPRAVDAYEFSTLPEQLTREQLLGSADATMTGGAASDVLETKPHFYQWATVQPGMICLARKKKTAVFRQYVAAETAVPVIACAACLPKESEKNCATRILTARKKTPATQRTRRIVSRRLLRRRRALQVGQDPRRRHRPVG